jgi:hypothetical protein
VTTIDLELEDAVDIVAGRSPPSYGAISELSRLGLGRYTGGFSDKWEWDRAGLRRLGIDGLLKLRIQLRYDLLQPGKPRMDPDPAAFISNLVGYSFPNPGTIRIVTDGDPDPEEESGFRAAVPISVSVEFVAKKETPPASR